MNLYHVCLRVDVCVTAESEEAFERDKEQYLTEILWSVSDPQEYRIIKQIHSPQDIPWGCSEEDIPFGEDQSRTVHEMLINKDQDS